MDYVKEIERIQRAQELRLRLQGAAPPELDDAVDAVSKGMPAVPAPNESPLKGAVRRAREGAAARGAGKPAPRAGVKVAPQPAGPSRTQRVAVVRFVLLLPALVLLLVGLNLLIEAWDGEVLYPADVAAALLPWLFAFAVLRVRREVTQVMQRGGLPATGDPALFGRLRWFPMVAGLLIVAAVVLSIVFPDGLPVWEWLEASGLSLP